MKLKTIYFFVISTLLLGCENVIEFNGKDTEPLLVVNSIISTDSTISVYLSESRFFLSNADSVRNVRNAKVYLWVNNIMKGELQHISNGKYTSNIQPKPGDFVKLTFQTEKFGETECSAYLPAKLENITIDTVITTSNYYERTDWVKDGENYNWATVGRNYWGEFEVNVKFNDPKEYQNYYRILISIRSYDENNSFTTHRLWAYSDDIIFGNNSMSGIMDMESGSQYLEFSDEYFNGLQKTLKFKGSYNYSVHNELFDPNNGANYNARKIVKNELVVDLQHITKDYFLYMRSRGLSANSVGFFSEPVQIHNNISNGIGILGSLTHNTQRFVLKGLEDK